TAIPVGGTVRCLTDSVAALDDQPRYFADAQCTREIAEAGPRPHFPGLACTPPTVGVRLFHGCRAADAELFRLGPLTTPTSAYVKGANGCTRQGISWPGAAELLGPIDPSSLPEITQT